jgi:hypothetical protein
VAGHLQAIESGHADIQQHDVGVQLIGHLQGLLAVTGLADHAEARDFRQQLAQAAARRRLVIDDQYACGRAAHAGSA